MRTDRLWCAAAAALILAAAPTPAQDLPRTPIVFLEKAHFSLGTPTGKNLLFEGQPTVHYFFRNRLSDQVWQRDGGWQWTVPVSALFQVRMSDTTSMPVRTPSYRIRPLYVQLIRLRRAPGDRLAFSLLGFAAGAAHYSNGQAGCTYLGFERTSGGDCAVTDPALAAQTRANTVDGDFSTSYVSLSANWRKGRLIGSDEPVKWQYTVGAEFQAHPLDMKPGGINAEQAREWGQHQWSLTGEYERRITLWKWLRPIRAIVGDTGVLRFAGLHEQRFGGDVSSPLNRTQLETSFVADRLESFGFFVRWHSGYDYYNIRFQETRKFIAAGVLWDLWRLDRLNTAPPP